MKTYLLGRSFFDLTSAQPDGSDADTKDPAGRDLCPKGPAERIPLSGKFFHRLKAHLAGRLREPSLPLASLLIALSQQVLVVLSIGQDFPPKAFEPDRYAAISERDPFRAKLIPVSTPPKPHGEWAKGLVLLAVTRINGKYVVHVGDTSDGKVSKSHRLVEGRDDSELTILAVQPHRDPAQVEVIVTAKRDGETKTATLMYAPSKSKKKQSTLPTSRRVSLK